MGSQQSSTISQSDDLPISPVILKLRQACRLKSISNKTQSFINYKFSLSLQKNTAIISRVMSPVCSIEMEQTKNNQDQNGWVDCCMISPIMAITYPKLLLNSAKKKHCKARINGLSENEKIILVPIIKIFVLENNSLALLVLEKPIVQLGWVGLTFFEDGQQAFDQPFKVIFHSKRQLRPSTKGSIYNYQQQIDRVYYKPLKNGHGEGKHHPGSLILKMTNKKPYLMGFQTSDNECTFINKEIYDQIKFIANDYVNDDRQRQILEGIDIQNFQIMSKI